MEEQEIVEACNHLIKNSIISWSHLYFTRQLEKALDSETSKNLHCAIARYPPTAWTHINMLGEYDFSDKNSAAHLDFSTLNQVPETHSIIEGTHSIMIYSIMYYDNTNGVFDPFIPTYPKSYDLKKGDTMARSSVQITTVCEWTVPFMRRHFSGPFRQKFFRSSDISVTPLNVLHSSYMHPISCAQDTRCPILLSKMVREPIYG